jgi:ParB family chromosome partitioning protein
MITIEMIPVSQIRVLNPRSRNKLKFQEVKANIAKVGLKKPITVVRRKGDANGYDLVCGQGRF